MAWGDLANNGTTIGTDYGTGLREILSNSTVVNNFGNVPTNVPRNVPRNVLGNTECEAMEVAVRLTAEEYSQAKEEIVHCSAFFWNEAKDAFRIAAEKNKKVKIRKQTEV